MPGSLGPPLVQQSQADGNRRARPAVSRVLFALLVLAATIGAVIAYKDPEKIARASDSVSELLRKRSASRAVQVPRGQTGEFALHAKINGVSAPMVVDTGATSVVLTYETAKAVGLPLELLEYDVDVETAGGHTRAARLTLDRLAVGKLVERSVPALVVPHGQMKTNLLGMSFLDRLESWEVRADRLMLHGYP
jgi:aspartyl protease family protein